MLEVILLIVGLVKAIGRRKIRRLQPGDFPHVNPEQFQQWQRAELRATDVFLWATWGAFTLRLLTVLIADQVDLRPETALAVLLLLIIGWVVGLVVAGIYSGEARKLKRMAGIEDLRHYYIRRLPDGPIRGPCSAREIGRLLRSSEIDTSWMAIQEAGQDRDSIDRADASEWTPLVSVAGVTVT